MNFSIAILFYLIIGILFVGYLNAKWPKDFDALGRVFCVLIWPILVFISILFAAFILLNYFVVKVSRLFSGKVKEDVI